MEKIIKERLIDNFQVKLFGKVLQELQIDLGENKNLQLNQFGNRPVIAQIEAAKIQGLCIRLNEPKSIILPNTAIEPNDCGYTSEDNEIKMWIVDNSFNSLELQITPFSISALEQLKAIIEVTLKSVSYSGGKLSGKAQIKLNIGFSLSVEARFSVQIAPGGWFDIWNGELGGYPITLQANIANTEACVRVVTPIGTSAKSCKTF